VPKIQPQVGKLHLFQRTAPWVLPKLDHEIPPIEKAIFHRLPFLQRIWRAALYYFFELVQLAQRRPGVMSRLHGAGLSNMRRSISDPKLREALTPSFVLGCKRILLSNTYYPALAQPNVEVVPAAVREIRERSIVGADGVEREVDTIIFGTGFHVTDPPTASRVRGRDGRTMAEIWEGSPQAYLGTAVAGFPNLFELIGPNTGNGHTSAIVLIEAQLEYAVGALRTMERENLLSVEVRRDVQDAYNERVQEALAGTVWNSGGCSSYYLDRNGRNATIYPWTTIDLRRRTATFELGDYETVAAPAHAEPVAA
jgi:cyclohexanone monooxygenase